MTDDVNDPFYGIAVTREQVEEARQARKVSHRNGGVCVCGHPAMAHTEFAPDGAADGKHDAWKARGESRCIPSKAPCECREFLKVLTAQDLRKFRHSTKGPAQQHALLQGVLASVQDGKNLQWESAVGCVFCKRGRTEQGVTLTPVAYDGMHEAYESTPNNVMVCVDCRASMKSGVVPGVA